MKASHIHIPLSPVESAFPPPAILRMRSVGIDITDKSVRAVAFSSAHAPFKPKYMSVVPLAPGIVESGYVSKPEELAKVLSDLRKKCGISFARATLPEEKAYLFSTRLPNMDVSEIRSALAFKIQENVPITAHHAVYDYTIIPAEDSKDHIDVAVTVVHQNVISAYTDALKSGGFLPVAFMSESQAVSRAIITEGDNRVTLIISLGENKTIFSIVKNEVVQFSSVLKTPETLTKLIERHYKVAENGAKNSKKTSMYAKGKEDPELMYALVNSLSVVKDEIIKLMNYWRSNTAKRTGKEEKIERLMFLGENVLVAGVDRYLGSALNIPTEVANVWTNAFSLDEYVPSVEMVDSLNYAGAIGLMLPERFHA